MKHNDNSDSRTRAIQTRYKGYHFRSRLEARYAVFFDALGIKWEYEKQGFDLRGIGPYLPDFWIPSPHFEGCFWVEIKGEIATNGWTMTEPEEKLEQLSSQTLESSILFVGIPDYDETQVARFDYCGICGPSWDRQLGIHEVLADLLAIIPSASEIETACDAAKSARFEFGETPECAR